MASVVLTGIDKSFGPNVALRGVTLAIPDGSLAAIIGPSGCGKTTLLKVVAGLEKPNAGRVRIGDRDMTDVPPRQREVALVFQSNALYPHMTAGQNIGFSLRIAGLQERDIEKRVREIAASLNISSLLSRYPRELSGGQCQRVAIGRAIVRRPRAFLLDEPFSSLDVNLRASMREELKALHRETRTTCLLVTHDHAEAMTLADTVIVMNRGIVEQVGSPLEVYNTPRTVFVATTLGQPRINLIGGERAARLGAAKIGIRPEAVRVDPADSDADARVERVEVTGSATYVFLKGPAIGDIVAYLHGQSPLSLGQGVRVAFADGGVLRFDERDQIIPGTFRPSPSV